MKKFRQNLPPTNRSWWLELLFVPLIFILRLGFLPPNVSGVGNLGFFSRSFLPLVLVTLGFDLLVGGLYSGFIWTYFGFFGYWLLGRIAGNSLKKQFLFLPLASLLFFLFSNLGVWLNWYPINLNGFLTCYTLALPFYRNTLIGDLGFGLLVVAFKLIRLKFFKTNNLLISTDY